MISEPFRIFVIGDIHGCSQTLAKLLSGIQLQKEDSLYFLGDYIDRGPDSKAVVDSILQLKDKGYKIFLLRGNHEQLMIDSMKGWREFELWKVNGGLSTMQSFEISTYAELSKEYKEFFEKTSFYFEVDNYILVHAGINFNSKTPFLDYEAMLWIRDFRVNKKELNGRVIVHGHTPLPKNLIQKQSLQHGTLNIDGGCVYKGIKGLGYLVAFELNERKLFFEECIDIVTDR